MEKILVPTDFSDLSIKAMKDAEKLAKIFDARITPIHVHIPITEMDEPYALGMSSSVYQDYEKIEQNLTDRLKEISEEAISSKIIDPPMIVFGNPAQAIIDASEDFDCIVMSTHGRTGFTRMLLGSVAEKVLRLAHVPVMVVEEESNINNFEHILLTTDFSENAESAYPMAIEFAKRAGSRIHLRHVLSYDQIDEAGKDPSLKNIREERMKVTAKEFFHEIEDQFSYSVELSADSPHEAILKHVKENNYNLIIMATVGRTGINYLMMGSTTANVVRHVDTAVFSINPKKTKGLDDEEE